MLYARKVAANHDIGTRIVVEEQTEIGAFTSQASGGPLKVTKILAAMDSNNISDSPKGANGAVVIHTHL
jgi:hypothetical protein